MTLSRNNYWDAAVSVNTSEALMIPTMGVAPHAAFGKATLKDTSEKLSATLKAFTDGQIASFDTVEISDNNVLVLDPDTFKRLDTLSQSAAWSTQKGAAVVNSNGNTAVIKLVGTLTEFTNSGLWDGTTLATSLSTNQNNLVTLATQITLDGSIASPSEISSYKTFIDAASSSGKTVTSNLIFIILCIFWYNSCTVYLSR